MRKMMQVNDFLYCNAWLPKLCIWLLLIFWATQLHLVFNQAMFAEEGGGNSNEFIYASRELFDYGVKLGFEASKLDTKYGPKNYFENLQLIQERRIELNKKLKTHMRFVPIDRAHMVLSRNMMNNLCNEQEFHDFQQKYQKWSNENDPDVIADAKESEEFVLRIKNGFAGWLATTFFRGMFLSLLLYLLRMHEKKGIVKTILSDKKRFLRAVLLWPRFITRYPTNVVREIVVEAELRRIGDSFRKLSAAEQQLVKTVANGIGYREWIISFRDANRERIQKTFFCALLLVIVIHVFSPMTSFACHFNDQRAGPQISMNFADVADYCDDPASLQYVCLSERNYELIILLPIEKPLYERLEERWQGIFRKKIDHVPLKGCLMAS